MTTLKSAPQSVVPTRAREHLLMPWGIKFSISGPHARAGAPGQRVYAKPPWCVSPDP